MNHIKIDGASASVGAAVSSVADPDPDPGYELGKKSKFGLRDEHLG
jgi:hypothetical protein